MSVASRNTWEHFAHDADIARQWRGRQVMDELAARGILIRSPSPRGVTEEAPGAYKDVTAVVDAADRAGLSRTVARLEPLVDRVTMTVPTLSSAPAVVFIVTGEKKAEAVEHAFAHPPSPATPASLIRSTAGRTSLIADAAAAAALAS